MKPFGYQAPTSLREAVALLAEHGEKARPLAGGTDLLVQMRAGRLEPEVVVDLKRIPEATTLRYDPNEGLTIGAAVQCYRVYEDPIVRQVYPGLVDAASIVGGIGIQGRATLGGNLCNSSPSGDTIPAMIVHRATCNIVGPNGTRSVPVESFCTAPGRNVLGRGELLISLHIPVPKPHSGARYLRFIPRNEMDIAVVGVGASVTLSDDSQTIVEARIALGAVAPTPLLAQAASDLLAGRRVSDEAIEEAAKAAQEAARPISDMRGTAEQRRHLVGVLTRRALRGAIQRARGGNGYVH